MVYQVFLAVKEKLVNKGRNWTILMLAAVLITSYFFSRGIIDFDKLNGDYLLVAQREGSANCMTTLKLNKKKEFRELITCFGTSEITGNYEIKKDTIFFTNVNLGRHEEEFYEFALLKPCEYCNNKKVLTLIRFKNKYDTIGHELYTENNNLNVDFSSK